MLDGAGLGGRRIHPPRVVATLYLDTDELSSLHDAEEGVGARMKVRLRGYGGGRLLGQLEFKARQGPWVRKETYPLGTEVDWRDWEGMRGAVAALGLPPWRRALLARLRPVRLVRYLREYARTPALPGRLTVDDRLQWAPWSPRLGTESMRPAPCGAVLELKYPPDAEAEAREGAGRIPFRLSRASKYVGFRHGSLG